MLIMSKPFTKVKLRHAFKREFCVSCYYYYNYVISAKSNAKVTLTQRPKELLGDWEEQQCYNKSDNNESDERRRKGGWGVVYNNGANVTSLGVRIPDS